MSEFSEIVQEEFSFAVHDYVYELDHVDSTPWCDEVVFINHAFGIGLRIAYERQQSHVFITFHKLLNGKIRNNKLPVSEKSTIYSYDFDDLLPVSIRMKPSYEYPSNSIFFGEQNGFRLFVREFASRLKSYGHSALSGDQACFNIASIKIKLRAKQLDDDT